MLKPQNNLKKNSFSRFAQSYNEWAIPQKSVAEQLASFLNLSFQNIRILDAGCGTGFLTTELLKKEKRNQIIGIDASEKMLSIYKEINSYCKLENIENLSFEDNYFHSTFSSFTLHWTDLSLSIKELIRVTSHNIALAIPVKGSLKLLPFHFPDESEILNKLEKQNLSILHSEIKVIDIPFLGLDLIKYFHYTGTSVSQGNGLKGKKYLENWIDILSKEPSYFKMLFIHTKCNKIVETINM